MLTRYQLADYLHTYLACDRFNDYAPNGLQVEGRTPIARICTAVTASLEVISKAVVLGADALLVHHGYFWRGEDAIVTGMKRQRLGLLMQHNLNLFAYHLPLDCHLELGNNARLGQLFECTDIKTHAIGNTPNILWSGQLARSMTGSEFSDYLFKTLQRKPLLISGSKKPIQHIAWCSGGAQDYIENAHHLGVDAYISGEISERTYYQAQELGLHYVAGGHHATERYGIQALGQHLAAHFSVEHQFIDSANPV